VVNSVTEIGWQEILEYSPAHQTKKQMASSFFRGDNCNFNPYKKDFESDEFLETFLLKGWLPGKPFINKNTRLTAFGSCFAAHLTNYLSRAGYSLSLKRDSDIYISSMGEGLVNVHALLQQFEWALEDKAPPQNLWHGFRAEAFGYDEQVKQRTKRVFLQTDVFVITLGLSEVWFDEETDGIFWRAVPTRFYDPSRHKFRVCSFNETKQCIARICELIFKHVPDAKILFTLSPIPLAATFRPVSCLTANSVSKSILRSALDEFYRENPELLNQKLFYFPSYEIITELFPNKYKGDNRHPHDDIVLFITNLFEAVYCESPLTIRDVNSVFQQTRADNVNSFR